MTGRIVAYGDAIAAGIAKVNPQVLNLAGAGRGFLANNLAPTMQIQQSDALIISIGWSDVGALFSPQPPVSFAMYERRYLARLHELTARVGGTSQAVLLGLEPLTRPYPGISNPFLLPMNQMLEKLARRAGIHFLDLATHPVGHRAMDGLLYLPDGYRLILARAGHLGNGLGLSPQLGSSFTLPARPTL